MSDAGDRWDPVWAASAAPTGRGAWLVGRLPAAGGVALDLGSGHGADTAALLGAGWSVTAVDASPVALRRLQETSPQARTVEHELPAPLPFGDGHFDLVVAGLSLHYFRRAETRAIEREVHRVVRPGGTFVARVNAHDDTSFRHPGREVEPGVFEAGGSRKRYFTERDVRDTLAEGWHLHELAHDRTDEFGPRKATWVWVARRT